MHKNLLKIQEGLFVPTDFSLVESWEKEKGRIQKVTLHFL